jgi:hypothetical protein
VLIIFVKFLNSSLGTIVGCSRGGSDGHAETHEEAEGGTGRDHGHWDHEEAAHFDCLVHTDEATKDSTDSTTSHESSHEELRCSCTSTKNTIHLALPSCRFLYFFFELVFNDEVLCLDD